MKVLTILLICLVVFVPIKTGFSQDTEDGIEIKNFRLKWTPAQLGALVVGSDEENTMLEVLPFIGTGITLSILENPKKRWGVILSALFFTEGESVYPGIDFGFELMNKQFCIFYNFGKKEKHFKREYQDRIGIRFSFNPFE